MLTANNLIKKYGAFSVVNNVSLEVQQGEIVSIVGQSGAGKSTLLHLLGGLDKPDSGTIRIANTDMLQLPPKRQAAFRNQHLGFVFQFHHLLPEFSALENVCVPLWIKGLSKKEAAAAATEMLGVVGLSGRLGNKPSELSGGEQQRVAIARALVTKPNVVMADEPTGNLDSENAHLIHQLFLSLREQLNQTIIMITHNDQLAQMTDRILSMQDGRIVSERPGINAQPYQPQR
jgi:lipoprotein-releasing system ATP-binding protein